MTAPKIIDDVFADWMREVRQRPDATQAPRATLPAGRTIGPATQQGLGSRFEAKEPSTTRKIVNTVASVLPGTGEGMSAGQAIIDASKGNFGAAALSAAGAIPLVGKVGKAAGKARRGIEAWHGSPHKFDRFDVARLGTGEGAQQYGQGLYFADELDVAKSYAPRNEKYESALMREYKAAERAQDYDALEVYESALMHRLPFELRQQYQGPAYQKAIRRVEQLSPPGTHNLYRVNLDVDPDELLDYDAPLSGQSNIHQRLKEAGFYPFTDSDKGAAYTPTTVGQMNALREAGVPGLKYLDQGSRGAGQGTRNYVMFDPERIRILETLALAGMLGGGAYNATNKEAK